MMIKRKLGCFFSVVMLFSFFGFFSNYALAETTYQKRELRAAWIASVENIDWPSTKGLSIEKQKQEFIKLLDDVKSVGMNAVVVQIKPTADAFYPSKYGPWSEYLTGVQGKDPGYDPLAFMVEEAHKKNLEFHAWINPYRITMPKGDIQDSDGIDTIMDINKLAKDHPARQHKDWIMRYGKQLYYNPGIPEAQQFLINSVSEVVKNYDIDAVHMDDYFYPYKIAGKELPDQSTYETYNKGQFSKIEDWRRNNVSQLVSGLNKMIKQLKPYVKFGIAPFGVWRNKTDDPTGSDTQAGQLNYDTLYADTREWIQKGYIDYITPEIYWPIGYKIADYQKLLDWWANEVKGYKTQLYIGQATANVGSPDFKNIPEWQTNTEYPKQIALNHTYPEVKGSMHFSLKDINANRLGLKNQLKDDIYKHPALIPTMPWLGENSMKQPVIKDTPTTDKGVRLEINDNSENKNNTAYYAIYRVDGKNEINIEKPENLLTTVRKTKSGEMYGDETAISGKEYTYVVTALDRLHNESGKSNEKTIVAK